MMSSDSDDTNGITMMPITRPAVITEEDELPRPKGCGEVVAQQGANRDQRKQAVNDGRDTGEDLDGRFHPGAGGFAGIFGKVDRRHQADRHRDNQGDHRDVKRAPQAAAGCQARSRRRTAASTSVEKKNSDAG